MTIPGTDSTGVLKWAGNALAALGCLFVAIMLWRYAGDISRIETTGSTWLIVTLLSAFYAVANIALAFAWRKLLQHLGTRISGETAFTIYGISQLAKYTPGNILHLAGRQALGLAADIRGWTLAKSSAYELGLIAIAGLSSAFLVLSLWFPGIPQSSSIMAFPVVALLLACLLRTLQSSHIAAAYLLQLTFLLASGLIFAALVIELGTQTALADLDGFAFLTGIFILAWTAGLVTPGAPAGAGIREMVLLVGLNGLAGEATILAAILVSRLVTVIGDLLFYLAAITVRKKASPRN